jgi:hypothetical protein
MLEITYSYEIDDFGVIIELNGKKNVVYEIRAFLVGRLENGAEQKQLFITRVPTDNLVEFIEFQDLTKELSDSWIEKYTSIEQMKNFKQKIIEMFYPKTTYFKPLF